MDEKKRQDYEEMGLIQKPGTIWDASHCMYRPVADYLPRDLVVVKTGDGWSLHAPGSADKDIASGAAPYLMAGPGHVTGADKEMAFALWLDQQKLDALR
jgi:hypothetical protein